MKRDSKVLNKVIELTEKGDIKWHVSMRLGNVLKYSTTYNITDNKLIGIEFNHNMNDPSNDNIIFNYFNYDNESRLELKEVYPRDKWSPFSYWKLKKLLSRLYKNIDIKRIV